MGVLHIFVENGSILWRESRFWECNISLYKKGYVQGGKDIF